MTVRFAQWTLDVRDVDLMIDFWSRALGYPEVDRGEDGSAMLRPPAGSSREVPNLWLQNTGEPKKEKNPFHPDLRPVDGDVDAEVGRLIGLGARHADVGQTGEETFTVLADPEGNEFCVLHEEPSGR
jgi:catechol 2,3-dioxygenase-like lactoylglutathione lyase family enzyme